jgi:hypothetical protein
MKKHSIISGLLCSFGLISFSGIGSAASGTIKFDVRPSLTMEPIKNVEKDGSYDIKKFGELANEVDTPDGPRCLYHWGNFKVENGRQKMQPGDEKSKGLHNKSCILLEMLNKGEDRPDLVEEKDRDGNIFYAIQATVEYPKTRRGEVMKGYLRKDHVDIKVAEEAATEKMEKTATTKVEPASDAGQKQPPSTPVSAS